MSTDSDSASEKEEFALELEERTSVVHRVTCIDIKNLIESDSPNVIYPFKTYQEAFEYGEKLENRSYPKTCGKCTPWKSKTPQWHTYKFSLENEDIYGVYNGCKSWLITIGARIIDEKENESINATYTPSGASTSSIQYPIVIQTQQDSGNVNVEIQIGYSSTPNLSYAASGAYETSGFKKLAEDLEEYVTAIDIDVESSCSTTELIRDAFNNLKTRRAPLSRFSWERNETSEEPMERRTLVLFVALGLVLIYAGFFFQFTDQFTENIIELVFTYGAAAGFIYWLYLSDKKEREPIAYILLMFCWGIFSGLIAAPLNGIISDYIGEASSLTAPFIEEPIKALGLYVFLTNTRFRDEFNSPVDGITYGLAVGMGFYASENFLYYLHYDVGTLIIRILFCWGHGLWVAIVGLWISVARHMRGYNVPVDMVPGLLVAMLLHFLWNGLSYIGLMTGRVILYFALWQLNYLRRMVREGKGDEMIHGDNSVVFTSLKAEEANLRSHSNKLLIIIILMTLLSLQYYNTETIRGRSEEWITKEFMHFSFDYPKKMDIDMWSWNDTEPDEFHGSLWLTYSRFSEFEGIYIEYAKTTDSSTHLTNYYMNLIGDEVELGEEATYNNGFHDILYRNSTRKYDDDTLYCVSSAWFCLESNRVFYIEYYSTEGTEYTNWKRICDSFRCH